MRTIDRSVSTLLVVDFQARLMPHINGAGHMMENAKRLMSAARLFGIPIVVTEQNAKGLGETVPHLRADDQTLIHKMTFDGCRTGALLDRFKGRPEIVVAGCETHVCVLQTVLGLLDAGHRVFIVRDALGSRTDESKETAIRRMERHGAEVVTTEMVLFEWLETAEHPAFREIVNLVR